MSGAPTGCRASAVRESVRLGSGAGVVAAVPARAAGGGCRLPGPRPCCVRGHVARGVAAGSGHARHPGRSGREPSAAVADAVHVAGARLRAGLARRGVDYVAAVRADVSASPFGAKPAASGRKGSVGRRPRPRCGRPAPPVAALAAGLEQKVFTTVARRQGSRGGSRSRFAAVCARPGGKAVAPVHTPVPAA
ncbi:transposase [Streptomyces griseomycini]|uniref:transposase n=1 Tax=Streptomyces griseomycini TaxID=66895 RepID=UPI0035CBF1CD